MIVCNKFVFLHLHKSGGTFVNNMMMSCIPYARRIGYHLPYSQLPLTFARLPMVGTVRNPWDYYVSWYHFQSQMPHPNLLFKCVSKNNSENFEKTIFNLLDLGKNASMFKVFQQNLPTQFGEHGINLTQQCVTSLKESDDGFYTFLYHRLYRGALDPIIINMEALREGLKGLVKRFQLQPQGKIQAFLKNAPNLNTSTHNRYQSYYSAQLKQAVARADEVLIEQHNYTF